MRVRGLWFALVVASAVAGCSKVDESAEGGTGSPELAGLYSLFEPVPISPTGSAVVPYPNNLLFADATSGSGFTTDSTLNISNPSSAPFVTAANLTDGFSTTASIFTDLLGVVDFSTATTPANAPGLVIITASGAATGLPLVAGVDYTLKTSPATDATGRTIESQRSRILIEPLKPLRPSTTYLIAVTRNMRDIFGNVAQPSEEFVVARSGTAVSAQTAPVLSLLNSTQKATLEVIRSKLVRPTVLGFLQLYNGNPFFPTDLTENDVVLAWTFTTESVGLTMSRLKANVAAQSVFVANTTVSTGDLGLGLADTADIYAGIVNLPYYLLNNSSNGAPVSSAAAWANNGTLNAATFPALSSAAAPFPCSAFSAIPASTTLCYPDPAVRSTETVPVLVTVPNGTSLQSKPTNGWPVAIFVHGITRNRTDMLALAPTLAKAGFVTVAIDQPLHGITNNSANPATNPFYRNQIFTGSPAAGLITGERTFNLDLADNTPDASNPCLAANSLPDGVIDSSGSYFINLSSLITSRDNLRQSAADVITLAKSIVNLDLDNNPGALTAADIDESRIYLVGQSLGSIVGITVLGTDTGTSSTVVDDEIIKAASLHVPGGGVAKLLDASKAFGPRIAAGLACSGVIEGTDTYETFLRFAQHLVDPGDPINYAVAANVNHAIHMVEVIGDAVVPNSALALTTPTASQDFTLISGYLSGTDPLYQLMGLTVAGPITPPGSAAAAGPDTVVQFAAGTAEHGTVLTPDSSAVAGADATLLPATCEMQRETAQFLATNGAGFQLGGACP
jgi:hypothetical protein